MLTQKIIDQEYKKIKDYLKILSNNPEIIKDIKTNKPLADLFKHGFNILYFLAHKKDKIDEAVKLLDEYNTKVETKIRFSKDITFDDDHVLMDETNYINVYIQNVYQTDIYSMKKSLFNSVKKIIPQSPNDINSSLNNKNNVKQNDNVQNVNKRSIAQDAFNNTFSGKSDNEFKDYIKQMYTPEFQKNALKDALARQKLQSEISAGQFYLYKTKPREIIFVKYLLTVLFSIVSALVIIFSIMVYFQSTNYRFDKTNFGIISGLSSTDLNKIFNNNSTDLPLINPNILFSIIIYCLVLLILAYKFGKDLKSKNDNWLYHVRSTWFFNIILIVFIFMIFSGSVYFSVFSFTGNAVSYYTSSENFNQARKSFYLGLYVIYILIYVLSGLAFLFAITGHFLNPKVDFEKVQNQISKYMQEF